MNYPNGQPYKENKSLDGRKSTSNSSSIEYGGRGMSLEKILSILMLLFKTWHRSHSQETYSCSDSECSLSQTE